MKTRKILLSADWRLDGSFECGEGSRTALRADELRRLPERFAEAARRERPDLAVICGRVFASPYLEKETEICLLQSLARIPAPVCLAPEGGKLPKNLREKLPANVYYIGGKSADTEIVLSENKLRIGSDAETGEVRISAPAEEARTSCVLSGGASGEPECTWKENTLFLRCSAAEGRSFSECGEKGAFLLTWSGEQAECRLARVPIAARKYVCLHVDASAPDLSRTIREALPDDAVSDCVSIVLEGECREVPDMDALQALLEPLVFGLRIRDETAVPQKVWKGAECTSLQGTFIRSLQERCAEAENAEERNSVIRALRLGMEAFAKKEGSGNEDP